MRNTRILRQMAGMTETPYQKALRRHTRMMERRQRAIAEQSMLVEMISRREQGIEGAAPMPMQNFRAAMTKMGKGEL